MYTFHNPKNGKTLVLDDIDENLVKEILDTEDDILIVYSSYSCAIKLWKWHSDCAGDLDYFDNVGEVPLPVLLGCTGRIIKCSDRIHI